MNRRVMLALISAVGIASFPKTWTKPVVDSVFTPAHAQTSCASVLDVAVIGRWLFTDQASQTVEIEFVDESTMIFNNRSFNDPWRRSTVDGTLIMEFRNPRAGWRGTITQEDNCVASEITITVAPGDEAGVTFQPPLIGARI